MVIKMLVKCYYKVLRRNQTLRDINREYITVCDEIQAVQGERHNIVEVKKKKKRFSRKVRYTGDIIKSTFYNFGSIFPPLNYKRIPLRPNRPLATVLSCPCSS